MSDTYYQQFVFRVSSDHMDTFTISNKIQTSCSTLILTQKSMQAYMVVIIIEKNNCGF